MLFSSLSRVSTVVMLSLKVSSAGWLRWVLVGSPAIYDAHRYVMVYTTLARGPDGQPHYGPGAGVFRVR